MDCGNYSYTGAGFASDEVILAEYWHPDSEFYVRISKDLKLVIVNFQSFFPDKDDEYNEYSIENLDVAVKKYNSYINDENQITLSDVKEKLYA